MRQGPRAASRRSWGGSLAKVMSTTSLNTNHAKLFFPFSIPQAAGGRSGPIKQTARLPRHCRNSGAPGARFPMPPTNSIRRGKIPFITHVDHGVKSLAYRQMHNDCVSPVSEVARSNCWHSGEPSTSPPPPRLDSATTGVVGLLRDRFMGQVRKARK